MKKLITSILVVVMCQQALYGACPSNVSIIQEGEKAACKGFLFSPETAQKATAASMKFDLLMEEYELILRQIDLYRNINKDYESILLKEKEKTLLWQGKSEDYARKYTELQDNRQTKDWLFFSLGVIVTIGAGFALGQANKGK